ncbi:MAG: hypothetical protein BM564_12370 [Bacteroidetes bacterium MedPE-SWsnd-G2]|nr:MAG: hypothetical protein BM564_12370 [Bacteroidetes bacterium MedPE-SWsnd-G2]
MIKAFSFQIVIRVVLILISCLGFAWFILNEFFFTSFGAFLLIVVQVILLFKYVNATNYALVKFLDALKSEDYSVYFSPSKKGDSFAKVLEDFNLILKIFKRNKIEKEAQFRYFKYILEHVSLGIISMQKSDLALMNKDSELLFINNAASEILKVPKHKYWHRLSSQAPWLAEEIIKLKDGGKALVDIGSDVDRKQISIEVLEMVLLNEPHLLITLKDIKSEIEQKEIEAWYNVIRILAHEMLNSFTPIGSLATTIKLLTEDDTGKVIENTVLEEDDLKDINIAASTIKKRSDGLLSFVADYRTIASLPAPKKSKLNVKQFLESTMVLMRPQLDPLGILFKLNSVPKNASILADEKLIEQVLINLINNSVHAVRLTSEPEIIIDCIVELNSTIIRVTDNGIGIQDEISKQIFIPFYTTKKNGSGIGLSLSKDIMKKHEGDLIVSSQPRRFTRFSLVFKN